MADAQSSASSPRRATRRDPPRLLLTATAHRFFRRSARVACELLDEPTPERRTHWKRRESRRPPGGRGRAVPARLGETAWRWSVDRHALAIVFRTRRTGRREPSRWSAHGPKASVPIIPKRTRVPPRRHRTAFAGHAARRLRRATGHGWMPSTIVKESMSLLTRWFAPRTTPGALRPAGGVTTPSRLASKRVLPPDPGELRPNEAATFRDRAILIQERQGYLATHLDALARRLQARASSRADRRAVLDANKRSRR